MALQPFASSDLEALKIYLFSKEIQGRENYKCIWHDLARSIWATNLEWIAYLKL